MLEEGPRMSELLRTARRKMSNSMHKFVVRSPSTALHTTNNDQAYTTGALKRNIFSARSPQEARLAGGGSAEEAAFDFPVAQL